MGKFVVTKDVSMNALHITETKKDGSIVRHTFTPVENLHNIIIDDENTLSIQWGVEDFEQCAVEIEELEQEKKKLPEKPILFNREKFPEALRRMMGKHDANLGITWTTVECYLYSDC